VDPSPFPKSAKVPSLHKTLYGAMDIRRNFLTMRMAKQWSRVPKKLVQSLLLEVSKTRLGKALSSLA